MYCHQCGASLAPSGMFCSACGARLAQGVVAPLSATNQPSEARNTLATVSLVLGIAGWTIGAILMMPPLFGLPAVITGHIARSQIRKAGGTGNGLAKAGLILGYATIAIPILAIVAIGIITLFGDNIRTLFGMSPDTVARHH